MRSIVRWSAVCGGMAFAAPALAQNVPVRTLSRPDAEYSEPFTQITGVRELKDGRLIVTDSRDKVVEVVDFKAASAEKIGREGSGPGEYSMPVGLVALPGDSTAVNDILNRRLLVVTPNAKPGGFIDMSAGGGRGVVTIGRGPQGVDQQGRFYSAGSPFVITDKGPQSADSVSIERWNRATNKRDTVAYLHVPKNDNQITGGSGGRVSMRIGSGNPFAAQDQWAVAPDGRIALVNATDYHIDWINANGQRQSTPAIRFDRLKVTEGHKQEWRNSMKSATGMMMTNNNGKMTAQQVPMNNVQDPDTWPEYLPPFLGNALSMSPDGILWVKRTTPAGEPPTFDLIDGSGRVVQKVILPMKSRLLGFGNGTVYVARVDNDDLQYLQRYRFAMPERP